MVQEKPSKNPRYLQHRPDHVKLRDAHIAEIGMRLDGDVPSEKPVLPVVHAVLAGRRANKAQPEIKLPPLAVFGPIHYQELPELFMDFLSSSPASRPPRPASEARARLPRGRSTHSGRWST
jgi:hypothetical protein